MPATSIVGLDTAKNVFQLLGADHEGRLTFKKRLRRGQVTDFFANLPRCVIGLEATQGAHHWAVSWKPLGILFAWLPHSSSSRTCNRRRTIPMMPRRSARRPADRRCGLFLKRQSNSKTCRRFIESEAGSSGAGHRSVIRSAVCWPSTTLCYLSI